MVKTFKNLLLFNRLADVETWFTADYYQVCSNDDPKMSFDAKVMHLYGKTLKWWISQKLFKSLVYIVN